MKVNHSLGIPPTFANSGSQFPQIYNVYAICGFAALGGILFGFDISSMSGALGTPAYKNYFNYPSGTRQGGITAR